VFFEDSNIVCEIKHFADELKRRFCEHEKVDYQKLCSDRIYKEVHRADMTSYYHKMSREGASFSGMIAKQIKQATQTGFHKKTFYIIPDLRHDSEIACFRALHQEIPNIKLLLLRVNITNEARNQRGWEKLNIDNDPTETNLDEWDDWDYCFDNSRAGDQWMKKFVNEQIAPLLRIIL